MLSIISHQNISYVSAGVENQTYYPWITNPMRYHWIIDIVRPSSLEAVENRTGIFSYLVIILFPKIRADLVKLT